LYYLNSRYYNPEWGRFLNADELIDNQHEILGHNVFVYCLNNPVNNDDPSGYITRELIEKGLEFMKEVYNKYQGFKYVIGEIKYVAYLCYTQQIKGLMEIAQKSNKTFVLIIKEGTKLSKPLKDALLKQKAQVYKFVNGALTKVSGFTLQLYVIPREWLKKMNELINLRDQVI
jgi:hypothetical protein